MPKRKENEYGHLGIIILFSKLKIVKKYLRKLNYSYGTVSHTLK